MLKFFLIFILVTGAACGPEDDQVTLEGCVNHPETVGFQDTDTRECFFVSAPSCVEGSSEEDINAKRSQIFEQRISAYPTPQFQKFAISAHDESETPKDCIYTPTEDTQFQ